MPRMVSREDAHRPAQRRRAVDQADAEHDAGDQRQHHDQQRHPQRHGEALGEERHGVEDLAQHVSAPPEPALDQPQPEQQRVAGHQVHRRRHQIDLDDAEGVEVDPLRAVGELGHRDDRGDGRVLEQRDEGVGQRRQRDAQHRRQPHMEQPLPGRQADRLAGIELAARHRFEPGAEHLDQVGAGIDRQRQRRTRSARRRRGRPPSAGRRRRDRPAGSAARCG